MTPVEATASEKQMVSPLKGATSESGSMPSTTTSIDLRAAVGDGVRWDTAMRVARRDEPFSTGMWTCWAPHVATTPSSRKPQSHRHDFHGGSSGWRSADDFMRSRPVALERQPKGRMPRPRPAFGQKGRRVKTQLYVTSYYPNSHVATAHPIPAEPLT
eukprot:6725722-Prymnesium_polylepis.1